MNYRVRWQHPLVAKHGIDQTRLVIAPDPAAQDPAAQGPAAQDLDKRSLQDAAEKAQLGTAGFSFLVLGDSGTSRHLQDRPQRHVAQRLIEHSSACDFILHTGDVVYLTGSSEQYPDNFIKPYREFIVGGERPNKVCFDKMTFKLPFLPVLGNHDYYDLSIGIGLISKALTPLRKLLKKRINLDIGWHGSFQGEGYARAFLDCLELVGTAQLEGHFAKHYTHPTDTGRCLRYVPGKFTRLPNRYYSFRQGGVDFFALDSNTFNAPQPLPKTEEGRTQREKIQAFRRLLESEVRSLEEESNLLNIDIPEEAERANHIYAKLEQLEEQLHDIEMQLNASYRSNTVDTAQLDWLRDRLIASWQDPSAKGRVLYFHHPPYVTEKTKWFQAQTLAVRFHLRELLDQVDAAVGEESKGRPLVDLVLSGHAHCFEYLKTEETGHGDRNIPWVVCGGSGFSLRRQRQEGDVLEEFGQPVAKCHLFIGRSGTGNHKRRPYSALRVDVTYNDNPDIPKFELRPLVAERYQGKWRNYELGPIDTQANVSADSLSLPDPVTSEYVDTDELSAVN